MEGNREVFFMKKKLSRLLCALLVMTMVLAMVPSVLADSLSEETLYVGDNSNSTYGCNNTSHTPELKYTEIFNGRETSLNSAKYVTYDKTTGKFRATAPTFNSNQSVVGQIQVVISCKGDGKNACTKFTTPQTVKFTVYSKATSITLKNSSGTTLSSLSLPVGDNQKIYYTLNPTTMNPDNIEVSFRNSDVEVVKDSTTNKIQLGKDANGTFFQVNVKKGGIVTKMDVTLDGDTDHTPVKKSFDVVTGSAANLTLKTGSTVLAQSNDDGDSYYEADIGATIAITATADSVLGNVSNIEWDSSDPEVAAFTSTATSGRITLKVNKAGKTMITATLGGVTAQFEVRVLKSVTSIAILDKDGYDMEDQQLNVGEKTLMAYASAKPTKYADAAHYAVWSISNTDILDFDAAGSDDKYKVNGEWIDKWIIDPDTGNAEGSEVRFKALRAGTVTVKVKLGEYTDSFRVTVKKAATTINIKSIPVSKLTATVRRGTAREIVDRLNNNTMYRQIAALTENNEYVYVPIEWVSAQISGDSATVRGQAVTSDGENNFAYAATCNVNVEANVTLTDEAAVTNITITGNKDNAIENDVIRLTANATVEPSGADLEYQWYVNGKSISGATKATLSYTIPKSSVDSSTLYKFTCEVTATNKGTSNSTTSQEFLVTVSRDYTVSVTATSSKSSYTVGDKVELKATLYYKGSAVSNSSFSWQLFDTGENVLDSGIATVTGNNATATVNTKGVKSAKGDRIVVRATVDYRGYSYSSSETITVNPAEAATVKQSVGSGAALKSSSITAAITKAAGSGTKVSYLIFNTPKSCTLHKSSSSSSSLGDTKCYVSTSSGQKLSDVYVKMTASSASVTYTAYDADDYVLATGTVSFDANDSDDTITSSGASFKAMAAVDQITEEYPEAEYVKLDLPRASEGKLYFDFNTISDFKREVKDSDKYYLNASSSQDDIEDVYFLPIYGVKGKVKLDYTAFSSSNSDLGSGTITVTVKSKTASSKFTDVTASNVGSWAADSIDFCADNDLVNGKSTYSFAPKDNLTRGQLVAILYRAAGSPSVTGTTNPFNDVKTGDYYYNAVLWAYKNDVVNGTGAGKFSPNANVTREQIAAILYRYMGSPAATGSLSGYTDRSKISAWATTAMQWAIGKGYITGTSSTTLDPLGQATRAQAAVMLHRFLTK